jgi:hypothetical protein
LTAVSAIVFFLGLLFGFQRPSRLLLLRLVCYGASYCFTAPHSTRGLRSLFRSGFSVKRPLPLRFTVSPRLDSTPRRGALFLPVEGRGTYFLSASRVNSLRRPFVSARTALSPARLRRFEGRRLLPPPRWESTSLADFVFRLSLLRPELPSPVRLRFSVRGGAASTTAASGVNLFLLTPYSFFQAVRRNPPPVRLRLSELEWRPTSSSLRPF